MEPFRSVRGGGARARLAAAEASLLRSLVGQVMSLVEPDDLGAPEPGEDAELAALAGISPPDLRSVLSALGYRAVIEGGEEFFVAARPRRRLPSPHRPRAKPRDDNPFAKLTELKFG